MAYGNLFNIPNEDVNRFTTVLKDSLFKNVNKGAEIYSLGTKASFQYKNFMFYFDIRNNLNTKGLNDDSPFKGTKVNIGFITAFSLKEFWFLQLH